MFRFSIRDVQWLTVFVALAPPAISQDVDPAAAQIEGDWEIVEMMSGTLTPFPPHLFRLFSAFLHEVDFEYTGFEWMECHVRDDSVLAYIRKAKDPEERLIVVCNFTTVPRHDYPIGVPAPGWYQEVFNSDSQFYGGSNVGNFPGLMAESPGWHGRLAKLLLTLPPLATVVLKPERK